MHLVQLKCPNCHATLEIEDTIDTVFCQYCGTRILVTDQSKELIEAKTKIKLAEKQVELETEKGKQSANTNKLLLYMWIGLLVFAALAFVIYFLAQ